MPFHVELSHASSGRKWDVQVSEACSFGQLKGAAANLIGVPAEGFNLIFRGRPKSDDDFLVDAGVGPGSKIAAAETAEWRRSRGADAAMARAEEQEAAAARRQREAPPASHPISSPSSPPENNNNDNNAAAANASCSTTDPAARQLDALEATISTLEQEAEAARLFSAPSSSSAATTTTTTTTSPTRTGLFSRHRRQQEEEPQQQSPIPSSGSSERAALYKEALRLSELSTQQLLKLDAVELPHLMSDEGGETGGGGERGGAQGDDNAAAALARERISALRVRRKALIKRAQALGDAMDRAKERLK